MTAVEGSEQVLIDADRAIAQAAGGTGTILGAGSRLSIREAAIAAARRIADTGDLVAIVFILPWHSAEQEARARYVDHSDAWQSLMGSVASGDRDVSGERIDIGLTFQVAHRRFLTATPIAPLFQLPSRIDDVFDD